MNEVQHTPGPWFVPEGPFVTGLTVETRAIDEFIECPGSGGAMSVTTTICTLEWSGTPVWEANARLIAAAPEMLEALEWAAEWAQESEAGRDDAWWAGLNRVKAAISKAKGKTP